MDIQPVWIPRITSSWEKELWKKKLRAIINRNVKFFDPDEMKRKHPATYDNKSPFGIARPGK